MKPNQEFSKIADQETIERTIRSLNEHNVTAEFVQNGKAAKQKALSLLPTDSQVMTMTSKTLSMIGLEEEINESGRFKSVRVELNAHNHNEPQLLELKAKANLPQYVVGSVHAVTQDGRVLIASNTGSQLGPYSYGAEHVIWVVGAQKIVKDLEQGLKRIYEYSFPLENERAQKVYGVNSAVNKILIVNAERVENRINMIIVGENLGF
jgi:L-lactate utilization protein LutC